jgi:pimeloyl-ACP methyl ester carboxylesterase
MSEFATPSGTIHYEIIGPDQQAEAVETLTLLHNFMSTGHAAWGRLLPKLAQRYRVLLPDLPGHGRSQGYPPNFDYRVMARELADLMHATAVADGHVAGCSAGGMIAQLMLDEQLVEPATLTLVSSTHSVNPATSGEPTTLDPKDFQAGRNWLATTATLHDPFHGDGYFDTVLLPSFRGLSAEQVIDLPLDALRAWSLPACVIHGTDDEIFPVGIARRMAEALPNAELHLIPGQTHALIFRQPTEIAGYLDDFLARHPQPNHHP